MSDVHDKTIRSYNMSRIRSKDTKPEILVRKYLFSRGLRYRLNSSSLPGKPDLVFHKYKTVIFVNGCFWHGHQECKYFKLPQTRQEWWKNKIYKTIERDKKNLAKLKNDGWKVLVVWECQLKKDIRSETLTSLYDSLTEIKP
ncbi:very short patch repair endonuclease [Salinimicrobium sediminilitoris]|uniref:very short patch repair endonuclease n=1 Tax=Salinimicrobium sediminilitoris TaxID=2876715 RepID=UPI0021031D11|nr:very short patch repair endonuclease [Salinimicrobium sediminilitoris]MCC8361015.1 very short patch repair endonuclease [Salinimicrobium sediminilitoris]